MANNTEDFTIGNRQVPVSGTSLGASGRNTTVLVLGLLGAGACMLFIYAPWSVALLGGVAVLVFSAIENEGFLLFVIFFMPFGCMLPGALPVRNMHVLFHSLVVIGFFAGRFLRGQANMGMGHLFRPVLSRASLLFFCAAVVPTILIKGELTHESGRAIFDLAVFVSFYFVVLAWADSRDRIRKILWALLVSTIVTAVFAFYQEVIGGFSVFWLYLYPPGDFFTQWEGRAASFLSGPNNYAGYLNLVLPFALACYLLGKDKWKKAGGSTFCLGSLGLVSTQSIGGLLGYLAFLVLAIFCFVKSGKKRVALFGGICASVFVLYLLKNILSPVHTQEYLEADAITRLQLWLSAWNLFIHSPVVGVGWGNFTGVYGLDDPSFEPGVVGSHNIYLQLLSETGLVGFVAFFYLVVQVSRQAWSRLRSTFDALDLALAFGVLGALLSVLVHGFVDFFFQANAPFGTLFWTLLALLAASDRLQGEPVPSRLSVPGTDSKTVLDTVTS